jgi:glycosyltransferase involved in cell wall biosynthesis
MLVGLPCVTTSVGGIPELAMHEQTALVVPAQDSKSLGEAVQRLLTDEPLSKKLGNAARAHAAANFSYQGMLDRMEEIYRQVSR